MKKTYLKGSPQALFMKYFNEEHLAIIRECVIQGYRISEKYCRQNFAAQQGHDLLPIHRRATIERCLLAEAYKMPGIEVETLSNPKNTSYYVRLTSGHASLTISAVPALSTPPRDAMYRTQYATDNTMFSLFPELEEKQEPNHNIYGLLLHGSSDVFDVTPNFMMIRFPDPYGKYLSGYIDLMKHIGMPQSIIDNTNIITEPQLDDIKIYPGIRRRRDAQ